MYWIPISIQIKNRALQAIGWALWVVPENAPGLLGLGKGILRYTNFTVTLQTVTEAGAGRRAPNEQPKKNFGA